MLTGEVAILSESQPVRLHAYPGTPSTGLAKQSDVAGRSRMGGGWKRGYQGKLWREALRIQDNMSSRTRLGAARFRAAEKRAKPKS